MVESSRQQITTEAQRSTENQREALLNPALILTMNNQVSRMCDVLLT